MSDADVKAFLKTFEEASNARLDSELRPRAVPSDSPIYHYTDAGGFQGIIDNDTVWLTDRIHLNDPTELAYGLKFATDWSDQKANSDDRLARTLFGSFRQGLPSVLENVAAYISSFSLAGNVLSQWCRYADDGRGFCLEFVPGFLAKEWTTYTEPGQVYAYVLNYSEEDIVGRQQASLIRAYEFLKQPGVKHAVSDVSSPKDLVVGLLTSVSYELIWNTLQFKHPAYADESEVRILLTGNPKDIRSSKLHKTRARRSELVSYVELPFSPSIRSTGCLRRVHVGPAATSESKIAAQALLASVGLGHVEVVQSAIPYRSIR